MSMSYDDCQDIAKEREREEAQDEIRQRLLGPIGLRLNGQPYTPLRELAKKCIAAKAEEIRNSAELADGYQVTHHDVGDPVGRSHYEEGSCWVIGEELMSELDELLDDLKTIDEEGW